MWCLTSERWELIDLLTARRRRGGSRDGGFSMVELLIGMTLLTVLGAAVLRSFLTVTEGVQTTDFRNRSLAEATVAMDTVTKVLQAGHPEGTTASVLLNPGGPLMPTGSPPVDVAVKQTGIETWLMANVGHPGGPSVVHLFVDDSRQLIQETIAPDASTTFRRSYNNNPPVRRLIASGIVVPRTGERPIFTYYNAQSPVPLNTDPDPTVGMTSFFRAMAVAVNISLTVNPSDKPGLAVTSENFVALPGAFHDLPAGTVWTTPPQTTLPPPSGCSSCPVATPTSTTVVTSAPAAPKPAAPPPPASAGPPAGLA